MTTTRSQAERDREAAEGDNVSEHDSSSTDSLLTKIVNTLKEGAQSSRKPGTSSLKPEPFANGPNEDPALWIDSFQTWAKLQRLSQEDTLACLQLSLRGPAVTWFASLEPCKRSTIHSVYKEFRRQYIDSQPPWLLEQQLWGLTMGELSVDQYYEKIDSLCRKLQKPDTERMTCFVRGLHPNIQAYVIGQRPANCQDALQTAKLAEVTTKLHKPAQDTQPLVAVIEAQNKSLLDLQQKVETLTQGKAHLSIAAVNSFGAKPKATPECQLCAKPGHVALACRLLKGNAVVNRGSNPRRGDPDRFNPSGGPGPRTESDACFVCGRKNHIARDCYYRYSAAAAAPQRQGYQGPSED